MVSSIIKWIWAHSIGFRLRLLFIIMLSIGGVCASLVFVESTKIFVNDAVEGKNLIVKMIAFLIGLKIIQLVCEQGEIYLRTLTRVELENTLELRMFCALSDSKIQAIQRFHSGDEVYRLSSDVGVVAESTAFTLPILVYSVVQLIATWGYLMTMQPLFTVAIGLIAPIIVFIGYHYTRLLVPISRKVRKEGSKVNEYIQEHLQHHELISMMGQNKYVQTQVEGLQNSFLGALKSQIRFTIGADSLTEVGFASSYLAVFVWGIYGINNNTISYGEFLVFIQLVGQLQRPIFLFKDQYPSWITSFASVERLMEITSLPKEEEYDDKWLLKGIPGVRFSNVSFRYSEDKKWIFENFNYDFKPGSITVILGETGVGKSTLIKMILAILSPQKGEVDIYSNEIREESIKACARTRCNCVYVPQGNSTISGTIKYNLFLGNMNATEAQMKEALYLASAEFVFNDLPDGLDTIIGERGLGISEGQAQRIAIARGLLRSGGLLLLDEPTSALDSATERLFIERLVKKSKNKTIIIITHKPEICKYVSDIITFHIH
ncbi:MAG: ABC transporter ATP-binding protein [Bacteroidaceae bacterium]